MRFSMHNRLNSCPQNRPQVKVLAVVRDGRRIMTQHAALVTLAAVIALKITQALL